MVARDRRSTYLIAALRPLDDEQQEQAGTRLLAALAGDPRVTLGNPVADRENSKTIKDDRSLSTRSTSSPASRSTGACSCSPVTARNALAPTTSNSRLRRPLIHAGHTISSAPSRSPPRRSPCLRPDRAAYHSAPPRRPDRCARAPALARPEATGRPLAPLAQPGKTDHRVSVSGRDACGRANDRPRDTRVPHPVDDDRRERPACIGADPPGRPCDQSLARVRAKRGTPLYLAHQAPPNATAAAAALANEARRLEGVRAFAPDQDPRHRHRPRRPCRLTPRALSAPSRLRLLGRRAWWLPPRSRGCVGASGCTNRSTPRLRRDSRVRGARSETSVIRGKERRMGTKSRSHSDYTRMWSPSRAIEYARLASLRARVTRSPRSGGRWSSRQDAGHHQRHPRRRVDGATMSLTAATELEDRVRGRRRRQLVRLPPGVDRANRVASVYIGGARLPAIGPLVSSMENEACPRHRPTGRARRREQAA
jgi:hypothetical protein